MSKQTLEFSDGVVIELDTDNLIIEDIDLDDGEILNEDGTVFTEAQAAALAEEIERDGIFRARAAEYGRLGGRPPLPEAERAHRAKATRLNDAEAQALAAAAKREGISESALIRRALNQYLQPA